MRLQPPKTRRQQVALAVTALLVAVAGGGVAGKQIFESGASTTAAQNYGVLQAEARAHPKRFVTPYVGPFNFKGCGPAITEMDRALIRKHFRKTKAAPCYGKATRRNVAAFQRSIHYKPTGRYTLATHRQLVARGGYTLRARGHLILLAHARYVDAYRNAIRRIAQHVALVGGSTWAYSQSASRQNFPPWPRIPPATDCSGMVIFIEYQAGAGPKVGYYGPGSTVGYTGTLALQGRPIALGAKFYPGDVMLYGGFPYFDAAIYIGNGLVLQHGGPGIRIYPFNFNGQLGSVRRIIT